MTCLTPRMANLAIDTSVPDINDEMIVIFILGGPGAGKGTQCKRITKQYPNIVTLSTGQLLREFVKTGTKEAQKIAKDMAEGNLVDIDATEQLLKPEFIKYQKNGINTFIIDGFPRDMNILKDWQNGMKNNHNVIVPFIIEFVCDSNTMKKRLLQRQKNEKTKRNDNNIKAIEKRIKLFENETQEVINYFKKINKYQCIDATDTEDDVFDSFVRIIDPIVDYNYNVCKKDDFSSLTTRVIAYESYEDGINDNKVEISTVSDGNYNYNDNGNDNDEDDDDNNSCNSSSIDTAEMKPMFVIL